MQLIAGCIQKKGTQVTQSEQTLRNSDLSGLKEAGPRRPSCTCGCSLTFIYCKQDSRKNQIILEVGKLKISGGYHFSQTGLQTTDWAVN